MAAPRFEGFVPGLWLLDAYGNGGFRFADMSHRGSILCLPSGISAWAPVTAAQITRESLSAVLDGSAGIDHLIIGTGRDMTIPEIGLREALNAVGIVCEPMATPAAARTYNVLAGERRKVGAALIAVD